MPLHDLHLEKQVLGACLLVPDLITATELTRADFYSESNAIIWSALVYLKAEGEAIDPVSLEARLVDTGQFQRIGGHDYLLDLTDQVVPVPFLLERLHQLGAMRRVQEAAAQLAARAGRTPAAELEPLFELLDKRRGELAEITQGGKRPPDYLTLSEFFRREVRPIGERLTMGFASLDASMRGGLPPSQLIALLGAPGARKTSLVTYWADLWERVGCAVVIFAGDEAGTKIAVRLGQLAGFSRDAIEGEGHIGDATRAGAAKRLAGRHIVLLDPRVSRAISTIESAERVLLHFAGNLPRVLIIDSLQSVQTEAAIGAVDERERITTSINVCRAIADRGSIVVAISEMSRAGYRTGDRTTDISVLASAKESGRVEYAADVVIGARPVLEEPFLVDLEIGKSRPGSKLELRLSFDADRASFVEVALPDPASQLEGHAQRRLQRAKDRIRSVLAEHRDLTTTREVLAHCDGTRSHNLDALNDMLKRGEVVRVGESLRTQGGT